MPKPMHEFFLMHILHSQRQFQCSQKTGVRVIGRASSGVPARVSSWLPQAVCVLLASLTLAVGLIFQRTSEQ